MARDEHQSHSAPNYTTHSTLFLRRSFRSRVTPSGKPETFLHVGVPYRLYLPSSNVSLRRPYLFRYPAVTIFSDEREHLPKLLINRAAENNSMMHVIDEHLLDLAADRVRSLSQVTN